MNENTLTAERIYELAAQKLTELWHMQNKKNYRFLLEHGRKNSIGEAREEKYWKQLKELEEIMRNLED